MPEDKGTPSESAGDGTPGFRPPPHPDDRLWRHPSEVRDIPPPRPLPLTATDRRRPSTSWSLLMLAGGVGVLAGAGVVAFVGGPETINEPAPPDEATVTSALAPSSGGERLAGLDESPLAHLGVPDGAIVHIDGAETDGLGFLVRDDGTVLTCASLTGEDVDVPVTVTLTDGRQVEGTLRGADPVTDLAVITLPDGGYPTVVPADTNAGTGLGRTVSVAGRTAEGTLGWSHGAVSSTSWRFVRSDSTPSSGGLMQVALTQATPASEPLIGGPVTDEAGAVIGITNNADADWAYATPINVAIKVADDLLNEGTARHGSLGIIGTDVTGDPLTAGVLVTDVRPDGAVGATAEDGPAVGDVIIALNDVPVPTMARLQTALLHHRPGDEVTVTYHRPDENQAVRSIVTLGER